MNFVKEKCNFVRESEFTLLYVQLCSYIDLGRERERRMRRNGFKGQYMLHFQDA